MFNNRNEQSQSHQPNPPIQSNLPRPTDQHLDHFKTHPPGYRFCPTDAELILEYLQKKVYDQPLPPHKIMDVNLYKFHPEILADTYLDYGEKECYFFTPRDRKYKNGLRPNRAARGGYWKATGGDKFIRHEGIVVGRKRALVFYMGKPPKGDKTDWIMHEFRLENPPPTRVPKINPDTGNPNMRLDDSVLCKIFNKFATRHQEAKDNEEIEDPAEEMGDNHEIIGDDNNSKPKFYLESPPTSNELPSFHHQQSPYQHQQSPYQHQQSPLQHQQSPLQHQQSPYQHLQSPYQHPQSPFQHQLSAGSSQPQQPQNDQPFQQQPMQNNKRLRKQPPQKTRRVLPQPPPKGDQD
ncbi:NAC transcription factor 32-like [Mercurialis annua]|uniref:NAC transcription factor 32-like n=1 Tax=Mercurialis annua TaxID=3986 RepID=UPI00215DEC7D|nr:NAC transcription factor 32-like [Mercurialis annua]